MLFRNFIIHITSKLFGNLEYVVTVVNTDGRRCIKRFKNLKEVDDFVFEINNSTYYSVQKIEKIRKIDFEYNKTISHTPLWFRLDGTTEIQNIDNTDYSFLKIDKSLINVVRESQRKY